ncbi:hypothetical protein IC762_12530 [Bradyrhizobium genosp. L]|uniref:hypothetical protein n=1 Tax=Bradyrhizobium genosp. L TaxID=83637 RepID=UPI0018A24E15|nr:hypothetical protein [Bradyrhizobium genosp. L]QPF81716.1 hypothetical protein IC762_18000 [Bradyrhizobium genosp. L]QPF87068.1 hypothetical protein IC762_12530 [Bradyrhizobium genosp. L]
MHLDCDTTPPLKSRYVSKGYKLETVIEIATDLLAEVEEGQIGIYDSRRGDGFKGYVIKYRGQSPYFEAPANDEEPPRDEDDGCDPLYGQRMDSADMGEC